MRRVLLALIGGFLVFAALAVWLDFGRSALAVFGGVVVAGLATLFHCCKRGWWDLWRFVLLGMLGGGLCVLPFLGGAFNAGLLLAFFVIVGAGCGLLFWFAAIWRNDGLTCPKTFCLPCGAVYRVARNALRRPAGTEY